MKRLDFIVILVTVLGAILVAAMSIYGWLLFIDGTLYMRPIDLESCLLQTTKAEYKRGEVVQAELRYLKNRAVMEQIQWTLVSDIVIEYAIRSVPLPTGQYNFILDVAKIPEDLITNKEKKWKFVGFMKVPVNPVRTMIYPVETTKFVVSPE